jgi:hypothetical protein
VAIAASRSAAGANGREWARTDANGIESRPFGPAPDAPPNETAFFFRIFERVRVPSTPPCSLLIADEPDARGTELRRQGERRRSVFVDWTPELQHRLAAPLRVLAAELSVEFPGVRVVEFFSALPARSNGCLLGLECFLAAAPPSQPDLVALSISVVDLTTAPRIDSADVCWGHPSGCVELEVFEEPAVLSEDALRKLREQMPNLGAALRNALRRGHPPNRE